VEGWVTSGFAAETLGFVPWSLTPSLTVAALTVATRASLPWAALNSALAAAGVMLAMAAA
jgi:hypothetical protein